jgi:hypothetical protein
MALVVEDGTGKADAVSFISDAEFVTWSTARNITSEDYGSQVGREPHIVSACDYLRNEAKFRYRGMRKTATQSLPYPRTGVVERGGLAVASNVVSWRLKEAQCRLAVLSITGTSLQPTLARGGRVVSRSVGPISLTYAADADPEAVFPFVMGVLEPLLFNAAGQAMTALPYLTDLADVPGFVEGEFNDVP